MSEIKQEELEEILNFAVSLARKAGQEIHTAFLKDKNVMTKQGCADLVTETDKQVEDMIIKEIALKYPKHRCSIVSLSHSILCEKCFEEKKLQLKFIGEESVSAGGKCEFTDDPTWIVDPLDGTTNFVHRYPYVAVCLGFCVNKQRTIGVVYNAISGEMFSAVKGSGAFCNGRKLQTSNETDLCRALIMSEFGSARDPKSVDNVFKNLRSIIETPVHSIHAMGSAALNLCAVAMGQAEAYVEFGIHCWDYCAASLILDEANGVAVDTTNGPLDLMARRIIGASNKQIAEALSKRIAVQIELPRD